MLVVCFQVGRSIRLDFAETGNPQKSPDSEACGHNGHNGHRGWMPWNQRGVEGERRRWVVLGAEHKAVV